MGLGRSLDILFRSVFEDVLNHVDPSGRLKLSSVRVVPSVLLIREGLLEGVNAVCFTLGNPPEAVVAFQFEGSSRAWEDILKGSKGLNLLYSADPRAFINSLLKEMGNIIVGPLSTRLSRVLGREVLPSVPFVIDNVSDLEKLLGLMGEGTLPVFRGTISDGHIGSIDVYIVPSKRLLRELTTDPRVAKRARGYIRKRRRRADLGG